MNRRPDLKVLQGGKQEPVVVQETRAQARLYPLEARRVKAEPQPPTPPRAA